MTYIDREKVLGILRARYDLHQENGDGGCADSLWDVLTDIEMLSTADVVEVVRCKDCKHRNTYEEFDRNIQEMVECHCCEILKCDFGEGFFCGHSERRTDNDL